MGRQVPVAEWEKYFAARNRGLSVVNAAAEAGFTPATGYRFEKGQSKVGTEAARALLYQPVRPDGTRMLSPQAKRALKDFGYFRKRYLGRKTVPWQTQAAEQVAKRVGDESSEDMIVLNVAPGSGKSTFIVDLACWMIARDRNIRILLGSRTQRQANAYARRVRVTLERRTPLQADLKSARLGLAVDAETTMEADFGPFKPGDPEQWSAHTFRVLGAGVGGDEKEATVQSYGLDAGFLGGRFDLNLWDDLVDPVNTRTLEARELLEEAWDERCETRMEPGGVTILLGQRLGNEDLYRYCLNKKDEHGNPVYHHITFRAHDESKCQEFHDTLTPWPKTCLLDPRRLPWRRLSTIAINTPGKYALNYQQDDSVSEGSLIPRIWIDGGTDPDTAVTFVGCFDTDRNFGQIPPDVLDGTAWSVVTVDPAPDNFWAVQWWLHHPKTQLSYLVRQHRRRMTAPQFLDMDFETGAFTGMLNDLWTEAGSSGAALDLVVVENNAAQKFMLQNKIYQRWLRAKSTVLLPHTTHINKTHPQYGIEGLQPMYREGKIRLPGGKDPYTVVEVKQLVHELTHYPKASTSDCVMANWFFTHHLAKSFRKRTLHYTQARPSGLADVTRGLHYSQPKAGGARINVRLPGRVL